MERVTLYLMTYKGLAVLQGLVAAGMASSIEQVVVGRDKSVQNDYSEEIVTFSKAHALNYAIRSGEAVAVKTRYGIAVSWRWIIAEGESRLIVLHDSILPKYRGFAPLVNQLINGESHIGVTAIFAVEEYDKGPIISNRIVPVRYPIRIEQAIEKIAAEYSSLVVEVVEKIAAGALQSREQVEADATYSLWRDEDDYKMSWTWTAQRLRRFIDAVGFPYNGAFTYFGNQKVRIVSATEMQDVTIENRDAGKVIFIDEGQPVVVCGTGLLKITEAVYDESKESIFPLAKFRIRFT